MRSQSDASAGTAMVLPAGLAGAIVCEDELNGLKEKLGRYDNSDGAQWALMWYFSVIR